MNKLQLPRPHSLWLELVNSRLKLGPRLRPAGDDASCLARAKQEEANGRHRSLRPQAAVQVPAARSPHPSRNRTRASFGSGSISPFG